MAAQHAGRAGSLGGGQRACACECLPARQMPAHSTADRQVDRLQSCGALPAKAQPSSRAAAQPPGRTPLLCSAPLSCLYTLLKKLFFSPERHQEHEQAGQVHIPTALVVQHRQHLRQGRGGGGRGQAAHAVFVPVCGLESLSHSFLVHSAGRRPGTLRRAGALAQRGCRHSSACMQ